MIRKAPNVFHVVIVGAGPYGLSLAAHLREANVPFRIFGSAMKSWETQMPAGMKLKSDGFASNLSAGSVPFTLEDFCALTGRAYHATQVPVAVEDFTAYGQEFARRFVPSLEDRDVTSIDREDGHFRVTIEGGADVIASHVVLATGVSLFQHIPLDVAQLPADMVTHSTAHTHFDEFEGRDVTVLGRGASSLNAAALLHEAGARVTLLTRKHKVHIHRLDPPQNRSFLQKLRRPSSPLGSGIRSWLSSNTPGTFRLLPPVVRRLLVFKHLGPSGGSALQGRVLGRFPMLLGWSIASATAMEAPSAGERRIRLTLTNAELEEREHFTSHIIAGTGFRIDLTRYRFLAAAVRNRVRTHENGGPVLNRHFETSVKGLYMIGPVAQSSFGPLLRFAAGAGYAADRVTGRLERELVRRRPSKSRDYGIAMPVRNTVE